MASENRVKIPVEFYEEVVQTSNPDELVTWLKRFRTTMVLKEMARQELVGSAIDRAYASDLKDEEIKRLGRDPFLLASAMNDIEGRCVVTNEGSKQKDKRAKRHIPDACAILNIRCCNMFRLIRLLNFRTSEYREGVERQLPFRSVSAPE